jgi:ligand-binding sensor domain-containing protein
MITAVETDDSNAIWIGMPDSGIVRFDGKNWKRYWINNNPVRDYLRTDMGIDRNGNAWLSSGATLYCFNGAAWSVYDSTGFALLDTLFDVIYTGASHKVWADSHCAVVYYRTTDPLLAQHNIWEIYPLKNPRHGSIMKKDRFGNYWHGTDNGLWKYTPTSSQVFNTGNSKLPYNTIKNLLSFCPERNAVADTKIHTGRERKLNLCVFSCPLQ